MVPLLDLKRQYASYSEQIEPVLLRICREQAFILGPEVLALEQEMAEYHGVPHALAVSSGTDALLLVLMALGVGIGDEVVTSPFTFFATAGTIDRLGAKAVFVDIDPSTYNLDPARLEAALSPRTKAIMPVHLFGQAADMDTIGEIARNHDLPVIEDAAQSIGAQYLSLAGGRPEVKLAGTMGLAGCLSFFPSKNLGAFGDAGLVLTSDRDFYHKMVALRVHGAYQTYIHEMVGGNFRMDALQAAVLRVKLPLLEGWSLGRVRNATRYAEGFAAAGLGGAMSWPVEDSRLATYPEVALPLTHIYNQYTIRSARRDELKKHLTERGIGNAIYYPLPLHLQPCFKHLGGRKGDFPHAEKAAAEVLALPVFAELRPEELTEVIDAVTGFERRG